MALIGDAIEWLEADGLGGFASGTSSGIRTRRYHALLLAATTPPTGRMVLVSGVDVWIATPSFRCPLSTQRYLPGVEYPDGRHRLATFTVDPWPTWTWTLPDGSRVTHELFVPRGSPSVVLAWRREEGTGPARLEVRPLLAGRDYHALHHENPIFRFEPVREEEHLVWRPYPGVPAIHMHANGDYLHQPRWYRNFLYTMEAERGLDAVEDLASPGLLTCDMASSDVLLVFSTDGASVHARRGLVAAVTNWRDSERDRRAQFPSRLARSADAFFVRRGSGETLIAGYPWFTDWGRDTFIALRGLGLATGRLDDSLEILRTWTGALSDGMMPNRFPDAGETPEYNAVDASLWFIVVTQEWLDLARTAGYAATPGDIEALERAIDAIVDGYVRGTRYGIQMDADGLLACGVPGVQLTWMDAKIGDRLVTPRVGKPVEVQALWVNALAIAGRRDPKWRVMADRAAEAVRARFWNPARGCLYDVVDVDHVAGQVDASVRPNQVLAVGGLPTPVVTGDRARAVIDVVARELVAPLGLRSLARFEPGYQARYAGTADARDGAYHQGVAWPWLIGPLVDAVLANWTDRLSALDFARRLVQPLMAHLDEAGLGHVSEITDGELPFTPRGCPFQAWSLGELIRVLGVLEDASER